MKTTIVRITALSILVLAFTGCSTVSDAGYYWGKYPYTYLETIRNPSSESTEKHVQELRKIIEFSDQKGLKPAPGVYAELAFWLSKTDGSDENEVKAFFAKEMQLYPESGPFIERLISN